MVEHARRSVPVILAVAAQLITVVLTANVASADPLDNQLIETTCSYDQLDAALRTEAPDLASELAQHPAAQSKLRDFLALPVDQRRQQVQGALDRNPQWRSTIEQKANTPDGQQKAAMLARLADTCHDY